MAARLIPLKGEELVQKILAGERDFSKVKLEEGYEARGFVINIYNGNEELQDYLKGEGNLIKNPIIIDNSDFRYFRARGLYLPNLSAVRAELTGADFARANLMQANLRGANLTDANLEEVFLGFIRGADLRWAILVNTYFGRADLEMVRFRGADVTGADFINADLSRANLKGIRNLEKSKNLEWAAFQSTRVTPLEEAIIKEAWEKRGSLIVEG